MADTTRYPRASRDGERRTSHRVWLAQQACSSLTKITGSEAENVTALERSDDGAWRVTVELLELRRTPETDDLIGSYEAELNENGELLGYRRVRRYARNRLGPDQPDLEEAPIDGDE